VSLAARTGDADVANAKANPVANRGNHSLPKFTKLSPARGIAAHNHNGNAKPRQWPLAPIWHFL
jgi:hypothetical protein